METRKYPYPEQRAPRAPWDGPAPHANTGRGAARDVAAERCSRRVAKITRGDSALDSDSLDPALAAAVPTDTAAYRLKLADAVACVLLPWEAVHGIRIRSAAGAPPIDAVPVAMSAAGYARLLAAGKRGARKGRMIGTAAARDKYPAGGEPAHRSLIVRDTDPPAQLAPTADQDAEVAHDAVCAAWARAQKRGESSIRPGLVYRIAARRGARHVVHSLRLRDGLSDVVAKPMPDASPDEMLDVLPAGERRAALAAIDAFRAAENEPGKAGECRRYRARKALGRILGRGEGLVPSRAS